MTAIYRYKQTTDSGMAPCLDNGLVTLATCKPRVRSSARPGDWVVGFRSVAEGAPIGLVIWAGRVAESLEVGAYERRYRGRSDAVYRASPAGGYRRLRPDYHPEERQFLRDTLNPVLVFDRNTAWYFGNEPEMLPEHLLHLAPGVRDRDFLVNGANDEDAAALENWLRSLGTAGAYALLRDGSRKTRRGC